MNNDYQGKHVVITGASGVLGSAVAQALLDAGATCHLPLHESPLPDAAWPDHDRVVIAPAIDLTDEDAAASYYRSLPPLWASIHLVGGFAMAPVAETSLADFQAMFQLNAQTCFLCSREAVTSMRGHDGGGRIVNVAARPAVQPVAGMIAYTVAKAAVVAITRALAVELHHERILVNAVVPSVIDTPVNRANMPGTDFDVWPKPEAIAASIAYLASPANQLTSGSLVPVYGQT